MVECIALKHTSEFVLLQCFEANNLTILNKVFFLVSCLWHLKRLQATPERLAETCGQSYMVLSEVQNVCFNHLFEIICYTSLRHKIIIGTC